MNLYVGLKHNLQNRIEQSRYFMVFAAVSIFVCMMSVGIVLAWMGIYLASFLGTDMKITIDIVWIIASLGGWVVLIKQTLIATR